MPPHRQANPVRPTFLRQLRHFFFFLEPSVFTLLSSSSPPVLFSFIGVSQEEILGVTAVLIVGVAVSKVGVAEPVLVVVAAAMVVSIVGVAVSMLISSMERLFMSVLGMSVGGGGACFSSTNAL